MHPLGNSRVPGRSSHPREALLLPFSTLTRRRGLGGLSGAPGVHRASARGRSNAGAGARRARLTSRLSGRWPIEVGWVTGDYTMLRAMVVSRGGRGEGVAIAAKGVARQSKDAGGRVPRERRGFTIAGSHLHRVGSATASRVQGGRTVDEETISLRRPSYQVFGTPGVVGHA